ncbi:hypothetical protein MLD38_011208 [Melastoma candidum]|uniref:Uncharacterized protein n=1 Tax=Melastoma candidum TaxID=119954 RepID=A0ACB9R5U6_9MYRT|nr:hypothetical protein MLD38_011208 [Melastoma candidum]
MERFYKEFVFFRYRTPLSGFHGVLSGFLVGIKQIFSDQELPFLKGKGNLHSFGQWLPSIVLLLASIRSFFIAEPAKYLPTLCFATYTGWNYLRY